MKATWLVIFLYLSVATTFLLIGLAISNKGNQTDEKAANRVTNYDPDFDDLMLDMDDDFRRLISSDSRFSALTDNKLTREQLFKYVFKALEINEQDLRKLLLSKDTLEGKKSLKEDTEQRLVRAREIYWQNDWKLILKSVSDAWQRIKVTIKSYFN